MLRCLVRNRLVIDTPEERVRQKLIAWLIADRGVPRLALAVEVSLSALSPGATGRADLLAMRKIEKAERGEKQKLWLLAECKAPGKLFLDAAAVQVGRYLTQTTPEWVVLTDGEQLTVWRWSAEGLIAEKELPHWSPSNFSQDE